MLLDVFLQGEWGQVLYLNIRFPGDTADAGVVQAKVIPYLFQCVIAALIRHPYRLIAGPSFPFESRQALPHPLFTGDFLGRACRRFEIRN